MADDDNLELNELETEAPEAQPTEEGDGMDMVDELGGPPARCARPRGCL